MQDADWWQSPGTAILYVLDNGIKECAAQPLPTMPNVIIVGYQLAAVFTLGTMKRVTPTHFSPDNSLYHAT
jgi:hypothetical protein